MTEPDPYDLQRFVAAQRSVRETVTWELRQGRKRTHWMWYVFPQMRGLGSSLQAQRYGIGSLEEARAYLAHPELGPQLREWTGQLLKHTGSDISEILGQVDALKFRSSMTLFAAAAEGEDGRVFREALDAFCGGEPCSKTTAMCGRG